jgi:hypothetical protein
MRGNHVTVLDRVEATSAVVGAHQTSFVDAKRELGAFVTAVKMLYGHDAANSAEEYWLDEFENSELCAGRRLPMWRCVTIAAASRLANNDRLFSRRSSREEVTSAS